MLTPCCVSETQRNLPAAAAQASGLASLLIYLVMDQFITLMGDIFPMVFILILAIFLGTEVISKVPSVLHTPLMSGANAISGVTIIGGIWLVRLAEPTDYFTIIVGALAIIFAMINVVGGFKVTDRMLGMFKKKK